METNKRKERDPLTVADVLFSSLKTAGASRVFGIPGDFALPLFSRLEATKILELHTLFHEPAVGFAADACGRSGQGSLGVAMVTFGAGTLNIVNAIANAYGERVPVVLVSGAPGEKEVKSGVLVHHQVKKLTSQMDIFEHVTCARARITDPKTAANEIAHVLKAVRNEMRPGYIEIPRDVGMLEVDPKLFEGSGHEAEIIRSPVFDDEAVLACAQEIHSRLLVAQKAVIVVGVEVKRYHLDDDLETLCGLIAGSGIPVFTSFMGHGLMSRSPHLSGTYAGLAGDPTACSIVENADFLFLPGVLLCDTNFMLAGKAIDVKRKAAHAVEGKVTVGFHSFDHIPLRELLRAMNKLDWSALRSRRGLNRRFNSEAIEVPEDNAEITPALVGRALDDVMRVHEDIPLVTDFGDCLFATFAMETTPDVLSPGYWATMGYGVPAAIGTQLNTGKRCICLVGDGAFEMTGWELGNCPRLGLDTITILFNNSSWGTLKAFVPETSFCALPPKIDFVTIAKGLGGDGYRVKTYKELENALKVALETRGTFQLIEVVLQPDSISPMLANFVKTFKKKVE